MKVIHPSHPVDSVRRPGANRSRVSLNARAHLQPGHKKSGSERSEPPRSEAPADRCSASLGCPRAEHRSKLSIDHRWARTHSGEGLGGLIVNLHTASNSARLSLMDVEGSPVRALLRHLVTRSAAAHPSMIGGGRPFTALSVDGKPVVDGIIVAQSGGLFLNTLTGMRAVGNPPAKLREMVSARVWIGGPMDTGPNNYGVIVPAVIKP